MVRPGRSLYGVDPTGFPSMDRPLRPVEERFAMRRAAARRLAGAPGTRVKGKPADYFKKTFEAFNTQRYHTPADEYQEDWDFSGYPALIRFAFDIARMAANAKDLPTWLPGDEFRPARERSGVK